MAEPRINNFRYGPQRPLGGGHPWGSRERMLLWCLRVRWTIVGAVALGLLFGCAPSTPMPPTLFVPTPTMETLEYWRIDLKLSGGIAGLQRVVELSSTGQLRVTDLKTGKQIVARAPEKEFAEVASLFVKVWPFQATGRPQTCADCLEYTLSVQVNGQQSSIRFSDVTQPTSDLMRLATVLVHLQDQALSGKLNP